MNAVQQSDRSRGWTRREIASLDPEVDYDRIVKLIAEYQFNEFSFNLGYAVGFHYNVIPSEGSMAMVGTRKAATRPQSRFLDTADLLAGWMHLGSAHPETLKGVERLNRMHMHVAKSYPESFVKAEDFIYPVAMLIFQADRMRDLAGAPRRPRHEQVALHHFWREIAFHLRSTEGPLTEFPATYEELEEFIVEFEEREREATPDGVRVSDLMIGQFNDKYFPRILHPLGRALVLAFVTDRVQQRHGIKPAAPALVWLVRRAFRAIFFLQDRGKEPTTPFSEVMASPEYRERRRTWRDREHPTHVSPAS